MHCQEKAEKKEKKEKTLGTFYTKLLCVLDGAGISGLGFRTYPEGPRTHIIGF